jgi:serine/threonine protein kinase
MFQMIANYRVLLKRLAPVSAALRLRISADVAAGVNFLHSVDPPLLHRDLKTPNVFLMYKFVGGNVPVTEVIAKVGDFGLSSYLIGNQHIQLVDTEGDMIAPRFFQTIFPHFSCIYSFDLKLKVGST